MSVIQRQRGAITLIFTFMLPAIVSLLAITVYFAMYSQVVIRAGQAVDSAVLACAYQQNDTGVVTEDILNYYRPNFVLPGLNQSVKLNSKNGCQISAQYRFEPAMVNALPVAIDSDTEVVSNSHSSAKLVVNVNGNGNGIQNPVDVALVMDISGSMKSDLPELKNIITDVIRDIDSSSNQVRFSIVPFQTGVGVSGAPWLLSSEVSPKCVDGLVYRNSNLDADKTVQSLNYPSDRLDFNEVTPGPWLDRCSDNSFILPLTNNLNSVIRHVNSLKTSGGSTASYQGFIWGVRTLTEQWQKEWKVTPVQSSSLTQRLILFTDGDDSRRDYFNDLMRAGLCDVIQQDLNIQVSFIGFGVSADRIKQFQQCAGRKESVFDASNTAELAAYFEDAININIGTNVSIVFGE
ncbi:VWA domain-containing protein [Moritella sp.]|uniref:TadE/TadG family type IV pilus assembly protein n=1 Tax=Moritella sp. TaxID=78556 RepID=UPI001E176DE6|nr:VWA domain-containing protein [Moritella sp.]MCJ8350933.1 VWA domain-containing protein [Moritella sp.]NQZ40810.1 VWA domain-containing protein [Moritella sp.]